jgi:altronate dehydratase small subunit
MSDLNASMKDQGNGKSAMSAITDRRLILLDEVDNVMVVAATLRADEVVRIEGEDVSMHRRIGVGHKLARRSIAVGETVLKYGAPIGSMTEAAAVGAHVHVHNMKSDYIPTYTHDNQADFTGASS